MEYLSCSVKFYISSLPYILHIKSDNLTKPYSTKLTDKEESHFWQNENQTQKR
jgi:hypothetical protein